MPQKLNILTIEDDPDDFHALERCFKQLPDFDLTHATTLTAGLKALDTNIDLVLLDLSLPDSTGTASIPQLLDKRAVAIVVLTGNDNDSIALSTLKSGAQDYLVKGKLLPDLLAKTCQYAVERNHLLTELNETKKLIAQERELDALEATTQPSSQQLALRESQPEQFKLYVERYSATLEQAMEQKALKVKHDVLGNSRDIASALGESFASPRDLTEIHSIALKAKTANVPAKKAEIYREEGLYLLIGLMGHLTSYYKSHAFIPARKAAD